MVTAASLGITPYPGLFSHLGMTLIEDSPTHVLVDMPLTDDIVQPFGYLHGGATLALLESAASWAATLDADLGIELPFGVESDIKHIQSARSGVVHGSATLKKTEERGERGRKMFWTVVAEDDDDNVLSKGTFVTKTVPLARLRQKNQQIPPIISAISTDTD